MKEYLNALEYVLTNGVKTANRTSIDTLSVFGYQMRFDLTDGNFPLLTTKKMFWRGILHEMLWFLRGETNLDYLHQNNVRIWDEWADERGNLGPIYGKQWRGWDKVVGDFASPCAWRIEGIDQIGLAIKELRTNPESRRIIVSAWNPADIPAMRLPPCHLLFQFLVRPDLEPPLTDNPAYIMKTLNCHLFMRSADLFLGVPFNVASYALLLKMIARVVDMLPGELVISFTDLHLYANHLEQARLQLTREPLAPPSLFVGSVKEIEQFNANNITLLNYKSHPAIKAEVAV